MAKGKTIDAVIADAKQILRVWEANPKFSLGEISKEEFTSKIDDLGTVHEETEELRRQLTEKVNISNAKTKELNDLNVRARAVAKGIFGADSSQYEQVGGTRLSDRKAPKRKTTKTP